MIRRTILLTGASRGLGAALARLYADDDVHLILAARSVKGLETVAAQCVEAGATITPLALDLASPDSINDGLTRLADLPTPDLVIANAGIFGGKDISGALEPVDMQRVQIDTNLTGTIHLVDAVARRMMDKGSGQIALLSSLAALQPQADSPAYSASKAGLAAYGEALGAYLADKGIFVSTICPGHIKTDQTAVHVGALPGLIEPEDAARMIRRGLERRKRRIIFPRSIHWLILLERLLPWRWQLKANAPYRYAVRQAQPDPDGKQKDD